ncbi:MAG: hypothetical protein RLZZ373_2209, partial [Pseudomonadota bacterium]
MRMIIDTLRPLLPRTPLYSTMTRSSSFPFAPTLTA